MKKNTELKNKLDKMDKRFKEIEEVLKSK